VLEEIVYGVIPQVMPLWISYALYRFESNVRSASVVGLVGAGGIGLVIWEVVRAFQFQRACTVIIIILVAVSVIDALSQRLRRVFI
jgi:phosphonate transport system permease protein